MGNGERDPKVQLQQCDSLGICVRVASWPPFFPNQIFYEGQYCRKTQREVLYYLCSRHGIIFIFLNFLQLFPFVASAAYVLLVIEIELLLRTELLL